MKPTVLIMAPQTILLVKITLKTDKWGAIHRNGEKLKEVGDYLTDDFGDEAVKFIQQHQKEPFMLYLSFNAVHGPLQAPERYLKRYAHIKNEHRRTMLAMNYSMDLNIGKVLKTLEEQGMMENTLIIFTSDNGGKPKGNYSYNGPLRGQKGQTYEGGIRVPFVAVWKGKIPAGQITKEPVHSIDILPTALNACGVNVDPSWEIDGVDLIPFFTKKVASLTSRHLFHRLNNSWSIRDQDWKLVSMNGKKELFNIREDIGEKKPMMKKKPEIAQRLQKIMDQWDSENQPGRWGWNKSTCPVFIGYRDFKTEADLRAVQQRKRKNKK